jgi:hypothetical protein
MPRGRISVSIYSYSSIAVTMGLKSDRTGGYESLLNLGGRDS